MRTHRLVPVLAAGALLISGTTPAIAAENDPVTGVGSTTNQLEVLGIDAGGLLSVGLLSDFAHTNIDPSVGAVQALASLVPLSIESPVAGLNQEVAALHAQSSGDPVEQGSENIELDSPVLSGTIVPGAVRALLDSSGAVSGLTGGVANLDVLGGLISIEKAQLLLGSEALTAQSEGGHGVHLAGLNLLDLEALLAGLGLPVTSLPLDTVLALVNSLGLLDELGAQLQAAGLPLDLGNLSVDSIADAVNALGANVGALTTLASELTASVPVCDTAEPVFDLLGNLIGQDPGTLCNDVTTTATATLDQITALTALLGDVLTAPLALLEGQPLLSIDSVRIGLDTLATDTVETSSAGVVSEIGSLAVGDLALPALGQLPSLDAVSTTVAQAQGAIDGVLSSVAPALGDLVSVSVLDSDSSVTENNGVISSVADLTGVRVAVTPDVAELLGLIEGFADLTSIGDQLVALGLPVPAPPAGIADVSALLAGVPTAGLFDDDLVHVLSEGLTVDVASATQSSVFSASSSTAPAPELPVTGSNDTKVLFLAAAAAVLALSGRRLLNRI